MMLGMNMIRKIISKLLVPKNGEYHPVTKIGLKEVKDGKTFIKSVRLIAQPNHSSRLALRIDYELPSYCLKHSAQFRLVSEDEELVSNWLRVGEVRQGNMHYLMNSISRSLVSQVKIDFFLSDEKYPVSNIYQFELQVGEFPIA